MEKAKAGRLIKDALLMLEQLGLLDFSGHASVRLDDNSFLINPKPIISQGSEPLFPHTVGEGDLLTINDSLSNGQAPGEASIHAAIYALRSDVGAVIRFYPPQGTTLSCLGQSIHPVTVWGAALGEVPCFLDPKMVYAPDKATDLARQLASCKAILLRGHGAVAVGQTLWEAFVAALWLEQECARILALQHSEHLWEIGMEDQVELERTFWKTSTLQKVWAYHQFKITGRVEI